MYTKNDFIYNEPHFTQQLQFRQGSKDAVEQHLLHPDKLVHVSEELGRYGDIKHELYFQVSNVRTMKIPVIFDLGGKKCIYIITYIMRHRAWQRMVKV